MVFTCNNIFGKSPNQLLYTPLQGIVRFIHPLYPTFPDALRLRFYPSYLHEIMWREASGLHVPLKQLYVNLGSSCSPTEQHPCMYCVKHIISCQFTIYGTKRIILNFRFFSMTTITEHFTCVNPIH